MPTPAVPLTREPSPSTSPRRYGSRVFVWSLFGLAAVPLLPEVALLFQNGSDLKIFAPVFYYQCIVAFVLAAPALLLPRIWSRLWVVASTSATAPATLIAGFYSAGNSARWNLTAHVALMQTNASEALGYLESFVSWGRLAWMLLLAAAFAAGLFFNLRSTRPPFRRALLGASLGLTFGAYGLHNAYVYGGKIIHPISVPGQAAIPVVGIGINMFHPLTLLAATHYNYLSTHRYYLQQYRLTDAKYARLEAPRTVPGAVNPRLVVVVVGESATRRHWALYGYSRPTTPRLQELGRELLVFTDAISTSVGTFRSISDMLTTQPDYVPTFRLFAKAGYTTHWISAQYNQGFNDLEMSALVNSCDERVFLSGAYDGNLVPLLRQAAAAPGRHMIFLNLMGSHVRYTDRYPAQEAVFHGEDRAGEVRAGYDNSIRYTDLVLRAMIEELRVRHESSCLLNFSDHGEDVFDSRPDKYLFRDDSLATDPMYEVPFMLWFSPEYRAENAGFVSQVAGLLAHRYQTRGLSHGLLALARLQHPFYDPAADVFSPAFEEKERHVGANHRVYEKSR